jgi:hypothetical protein
MPRPMMVSLDSKTSEFSFQKLERRKLYGSKRLANVVTQLSIRRWRHYPITIISRMFEAERILESQRVAQACIHGSPSSTEPAGTLCPPPAHWRTGSKILKRNYLATTVYLNFFATLFPFMCTMTIFPKAFLTVYLKVPFFLPFLNICFLTTLKLLSPRS